MIKRVRSGGGGGKKNMIYVYRCVYIIGRERERDVEIDKKIK